MGNTGITLPFLAGALAFKRGENSVSADGLKSLMNTMISSPEPGYFVGVRWCGNIQTPVLSSLPYDDALIRKCEIFSPNGQVSFAFSPDAMSSIGGLDCHCALSCTEKLIQFSLPYTVVGHFSRVYNKDSNGFIYSTFLPREIEFIRRTLGD